MNMKLKPKTNIETIIGANDMPFQLAYSRIPTVLNHLADESDLNSRIVTQYLGFLYRFTSSVACMRCEDLSKLWTQKLVKFDLVDICILRIWNCLENIEFISSTTEVYQGIVSKQFVQKTIGFLNKKTDSQKKDKKRGKSDGINLKNRRPSLPLPTITSPKPGEDEPGNSVSESKNVEVEEPPHVIALENFLLLRSLMWNGSSCCAELCVHLIAKGFMQKMLKILSRDDFIPTKFADDPIRIQICKDRLLITLGLTGVIHNCLRHNREATKKALREHDGVQLFVKYLKADVPMVTTKAAIILAYTIEENELELIDGLHGILEYILDKLIIPALRNSDRKALGFSVEETLNALTELASGEENKRKMVKLGYLNPICDIISTQTEDDKYKKQEESEEELEAATRLLWILSFLPENMEKINQFPDTLQIIRNLENVEHKSISRSCKGLLWNLDGKRGDSDSITKNSGVDSKIRQHIMISYDHQHKDVVRELNRCLQHRGYNTWLDADKMSGSTLQSMAEAVENASVVIMCVSERYKNSPSCRTEAEYAYKLRKEIIPIRTQYRYQSDGWLGILMGTRLYFDCYSMDQVQICAEKVATELDSREKLSEGINMQNEKPDEGPNFGRSKFESWSSGEVHGWMVENGLDNWTGVLSSINGAHLAELKSMYHRVPNCFYELIKLENGKAKLIDILKLTKCLQQL